MSLSKYLFWDVDFNTLDYDNNAHFIISRVALKGSLDDWFFVKNYYGLNAIKDILLKTRYLDKVSLNFFSFYFDTPKEQFRCYDFQQSNQQLWNY